MPSGRCEACSRSRPDHPDIVADLGAVLLAKGRGETGEAIRLLERGVRLNGARLETIPALEQIAVLRRSRGEEKEGLAALRDAEAIRALAREYR